MTDTLSERGRAHLEQLRELDAQRRTIDPQGVVMRWRDVLFCAASNLECRPPQHQPTTAALLRELADVLVELDLAVTDLATTRSVMRLVQAPRLRLCAAKIETATDPAVIAGRLRMLRHVADSLESI